MHSRHLCNLGSGFLIAVLPHICHAKLGKQHNIGRRECLRDRDDCNVIDGAASSGARGRDALSKVLKIRCELAAPRIAPAGRRSHAVRRSHADRQIRAPIRPVTLSRR